VDGIPADRREIAEAGTFSGLAGALTNSDLNKFTSLASKCRAPRAIGPYSQPILTEISVILQ